MAAQPQTDKGDKESVSKYALRLDVDADGNGDGLTDEVVGFASGKYVSILQRIKLPHILLTKSRRHSKLLPIQFINL
jgi:hypothetical protein